MGILDRFRRDPVEDREASTVTAANSSDPWPPAPSNTWAALAVVEACAGLWSRAFAAADSPLPPVAMAAVGRALYERGEAVLIRDGTEWLIAASHDLQGAPAPSTWRYVVTVGGPSGASTVRRARRFVAHPRINATVQEPWRGRAPLAVARTTADLAFRLESSLGNEQKAPVGHILPVPDISQAEDIAAALPDLGGRTVLGETMRSGWDQGAKSSPVKEWEPIRIGPAPTKEQVELRGDVAMTLLAASGVPPSLLLGQAGGAEREGWRRFLHATIAPVGRIVGNEIGRVLGRTVTIGWDSLFASDLAGRARAYKQLTEAGVSPQEASRICGFSER